jgi:hypothetical protein
VSVKTFTFTVEPTISVPAWFSTLAPKTWLRVADGSGQPVTGGSTLTQNMVSASYVWPQDPNDPLNPATPQIGPFGTVLKPAAYCQNSNGMAVDAETGECFLPGNGGHGGYMGNETMRLRLRQDTPTWDRYIDSTPPWHVATTQINTTSYDSPEGDLYGTLAYHCYTDGPTWTFPSYTKQLTEIRRRPPATHTSCLPVYSEGKVWLPLQNSSNFTGGTSTFTKTAVNIAAVRNDASLRQWRYGNIAPWEFHGVMTEQGAINQSLFLFPCAALDPTTGRIWVCPGTSSSMRTFWMLETRGANAGRHQVFSSSATLLRTDNAVSGDITTGVLDGSGNPIKLFAVYGRRLQARDVYVLNITALEAANPNIPYSGTISTNAWTQYTATDATPMRWVCAEQFAQGKDPSGTWGPQQAWGMVWHEQSLAWLLFNCDNAVDLNRARNGYLRKLSLPLTAGRYDPTQPWLYAEVPTSGTVPDPLLPAATGTDSLVRGGSFSRFNILRNFDRAGHDLLVSVNADDKGVSVMKLDGAV